MVIFYNRELAMFGGQKLKIPRLLLLGKMRTQQRFKVKLKKLFDLLINPDITGHAHVPTRPHPGKSVQNASHKILQAKLNNFLINILTN